MITEGSRMDVSCLMASSAPPVPGIDGARADADGAARASKSTADVFALQCPTGAGVVWCPVMAVIRLSRIMTVDVPLL